MVTLEFNEAVSEEFLRIKQELVAADVIAE
jgi:hypothetical protein